MGFLPGPGKAQMVSAYSDIAHRKTERLFKKSGSITS